MWNRRTVRAAIIFLVIGGAIGVTIAYGVYYRSDAHRLNVQNELEAFFGMPVEIARVRPYSFSAQAFSDVEIWLPDRRARIFSCPTIIWNATGDGIEPGAVLDLYDAALAMGSDRWQEQDYMRVLRASLKHDFRRLGLRKVQFHNARFDMIRSDVRLQAGDVDGRVLFDETGAGKATLVAHRLNGADTTEPIRIGARIDPRIDDFLPEVVLTVPALPVQALRLRPLVGGDVTNGTFEGRLVFRQAEGASEIEISGSIRDLELGEWSGAMQISPLHGRLELEIERALIRNRSLEHISFKGRIHDANLDGLLSEFGIPPAGGEARLTVYEAELSPGHIHRLGLAGQWRNGSLDALTRALLDAPGGDGKLHVTLHALIIEDNVPISGDVVIEALPSTGETADINRELLMALFRQHLQINLPSASLPESISYVHMGVRLLIHPDEVRIQAAPGPAGPAIITTRLHRLTIPLMSRFQEEFPIEPWRKRLLERFDRLPLPWLQPRASD